MQNQLLFDTQMKTALIVIKDVNRNMRFESFKRDLNEAKAIYISEYYLDTGTQLNNSTFIFTVDRVFGHPVV